MNNNKDLKEMEEKKELKRMMLWTAALVAAAFATKIAFPEKIPFEQKVDVQKTPEEELMRAAVLGDLREFQQIFSEGADINYQDPKTGKTVLMEAIDNNRSLLNQGSACEMVKTALESKKVDLTLQDSCGHTLKDYVKATIAGLERQSSAFNPYVGGAAAGSLSERWKEVLKTIQTMQQKEANSSVKKTNFHAFYMAREGRSS